MYKYTIDHAKSKDYIYDIICLLILFTNLYSGNLLNVFPLGWAVNAVGRKYSHKFGYGLLDAGGS
jgi:hypothetical protein